MPNNITSSANYSFNSYNQAPSNPYMQINGNTVTCHGQVTEIDHHEMFYSKFHKIINALFFGEPFQLGHQTVEYTIRVEEMSNSANRNVTDFQLYGNYMGLLYPGDEVDLVATNGNNKKIVKSIYNVTSGCNVKPGAQIPASLIRACALIVIIFSTIVPIIVGAGVAAGATVGESGGATDSLAGLLLMAIVIISIIPRTIRKWIGKVLFRK